MSKYISILYFIIAVIIIIIGWLILISCRDLNFNPDSSAGLIVAALGVLVTVLIGWQIFSAIEIRNTIMQHDKKIKKYEVKITRMENDIKRKSVENRYYSKYINMLIKTRDDDRWNDSSLFYIDACEAIKCLLLSGFQDIESGDTEKGLFDLFFILDECLDNLIKNENSNKIKVFNNYTALYNDLYTTLTTIMTKTPDVDNCFIELLNKIHLKRIKLLSDYGTISHEEMEEYLNVMRDNSKSDANEE